MSTVSDDLSGFEPVYRDHVAKVVSGDLRGVMADMDPKAVAHVFDGVDVPRGEVNSADVVSVSVCDGRGVGEAVYATAAGFLGLRSGWVRRDGRWLADSLENFDPPRDAR
jgi:hypothetical protein